MRVRPSLPAIVVAVLAFASSAAAQTAADLFNDATVHEIRLSINSRDLREFRANILANTYYPADFAWRNLKVRNVAFRSRGMGSRNSQKPGYRIDFGYYTTGQTFVGLSSLILDNMWQDDAFIREKLTFTLFEKLGLPAPRESFCRLYVNNEYQGLYQVTEEISADFVKRVTGNSDGTLFEYHWLPGAANEWRAEDLGSVAAYKPRFEPRTHVLDADTTLYTPIVNFFKEVNAPDDAVWRSRVEEYIDLTAFMTHVAIEEFVVENDGILGYAGMNNFFIYREPNSNKHRLFVWDKDQAFLFAADQSAVRTTDGNVLFRRAIAYPDLRETYLATLEACARVAAADNFLSLEIDRVVGIIFDAATSDPKKQFDNARVNEAVYFLRVFAAVRPQFVLDQVANIRRTAR